MDEIDPIALAIPFFFILILVEVLVAWRKRRKVYHFADSITDLACGVTQQMLVFFPAAALLAVYVYAYDHWRLVTFAPGSIWPWVIAVFGVDVCYYWWHRLSHQINFMWATHVVHHSSEDFNFAVALRQAVLSDVMLTPFYLTLAFVGVTPLAVMTVRALSTLYQFWIHTELIGKLGPLDRWINTPSAHRVHHAINKQYIDRNYAAVFMIWDRLFGSYEPEAEAPVFGISTPLKSFNPIWAQFHYWVEMWRIARKAPSLLTGLQIFVRGPGWRPPWMPEKPPRPRFTPETFVKYAAVPRPGLNLYVGFQFSAVVVATFVLLMWGHRLGMAADATLAGMGVLSLLAWGGLFEAKPWAAALEWGRLTAAPVACAVLIWRAGEPLYWTGLAAALAAGSAWWLSRTVSRVAVAQPA